MSKLPEKYKFIDLSDYGRPVGHWIASQLQYSLFTPIHVTSMFIVAGLIAIVFMIKGYYITCLLYTSPSPRDAHESRMPSSA